jgi:pimeloyl-ACP methyl ester carboxylesterase
MAGDDRVISGFKNKMEVNMSNLMPDSAVAHNMYEQQQPVEQEQQQQQTRLISIKHHPMKKTIVFIHGMFQNPKSWEKWIAYFTKKGYDCIAPAWPMHEGSPANLRDNPPAGLGDLGLQTIVDEMERVVRSLPEPPIVIGHSVGALVLFNY